MGKKPAAKKKGKGPDLRGYATSSVPKKEEVPLPSAGKEATATETDDTPVDDAAREAGATQNGERAVDPANGEAGNVDDEEEDWEKAGEIEVNDANKDLVASKKSEPEGGLQNAGGGGDEPDLDDEEWQLALEKRLDTELEKCLDRRFVATDATAQFERRSTFAPAGVVLFSSRAEQCVEAALAPLRDEDGALRPVFPKHWRYRGKLTWERLNGIYLALESLQFKADQIHRAMENTYGYDVRAALEWLLLNLRKEQLPKQFGGEGATVAAETTASITESGQDTTKIADEVDSPACTQDAEDAEESGADNGKTDEKAQDEENEDEGGADADDVAGQDGKQAKQEAEKPKVIHATPQPKSREDETREVAEMNKRWALQYLEAEDEDDDYLLTEEEKLDKERKKDPTARYNKIARQFEDLMKLAKALKEKKRQGAFKQNISADMEKQRKAAAQMANIRAEMEALEAGKYGKLNWDSVKKPRSAPAATNSAPKKAKAQPPSADAQTESPVTAAAAADEAEEIEMPSLFDGDSSLLAEPAVASDGLPPCRQYNIMSWSGKTPRNMLEEFLRKRVWGKSPPDKVAIYDKLPTSKPGRFVYQVSIKQPRNNPTLVFSPEEPCETDRDALNLAAMLAIYKMSEEHDHGEVTRGLPPAFKQRLQDWKEEAAAKLREERRESVRSRVTFITEALRNKPPVVSLSDSREGVDTAAAAAAQANAGRRLVGAEDDDDFVELSAGAAAKLREDYRRRQDTLRERQDFMEIQEQRERLPVAEYRDKLVRSIKCSGVLVVSGATGSGKTTQVPQFVLEDALERHASDEPMPNIIVTEPRRISAISVAQRVSQEMGDPAGGPGSRGSLVGYSIRLEKKTTDTTRLLFCTVGVLLKRMQQGLGVLSKVTHIFIDEVHERSADCDLLLLLLRQIRHTRPELRIVLMSATVETNKLVRYFGNAVPVIDVPGRTFPIEAFWLEDIIEMTGYDCGEESEFAKRGWRDGGQRKTFEVSGARGKTQKLTEYLDDEDDWACDDEAEFADPNQYHQETLKALARMDHTKINYQLVVMMLEYIEGSEHFTQNYPRDDGAVLIFLPGLGEISKMHEWITRSPVLGDYKRFQIISLHSVLSGEDHQKAFQRPPRGMRKIVLSTNIAETGVTIPDVVYVIDCSKVKANQYHEPSNTSSLKEKFVSRAEVMQRRGRAGRVREGFSFHLLTKRRFELRLQDMPTPEILRCSLMELMLSVLSSGLQPSCFLECLDPPPKTRIDQAITTLKAVGAVEESSRPANALRIGQVDDEAWFVTTPIGSCLSRLPCDVRLGKMVLLSALFGGVEAVVTIAATLSHRSPLSTPFSEAKRAQAKSVHVAELLPKDGPPSDHFALNVAYNKWDEARKSKSVDSFCRKSWLSGQVLQTIREIKLDLQDSLKNEGFCEKFEKADVPPQEIRSVHTVSALLFAGLFPNVARTDTPKNASDKCPTIWSGSEQLRLHPGSLCGGRTEGLHRTNLRWICYHTKMKTSQVFLRDATFLTPNALLLFGGDTAALNIHPVEKSVSIGFGAERNWHCFHAAPRSVAAIRQLRYAFDATLRRKASDPRKPLSKEDRMVVAAYLAVINSVDTV